MTDKLITATLYFKPDDPETERIESVLNTIQPLIPHRVVKINVMDDPIVRDRYMEKCPVIEVGPYLVTSPMEKTDLIAAIGAARDRQEQLEKSQNREHKRKTDHGIRVSGFDKFSYWFSKSYMVFFNLLVFLYVGIPFLAPVLYKIGLEKPAKAIYTLYTPFCHQMAFRSWFLFGEQAYYPRELARIPNVLTYEEVTGNDSRDPAAARKIVGNEQMGYKIALCERDTALYGSILLFGLIFMFTGRKIKVIPWYIWVFLGILPIGLDGGSQLPGLIGLNLPGWMIRESTPLLRTITGGLFGFLTAWYLYPMIEESMRDTRIILSKKIASVQQKLQGKEV